MKTITKILISIYIFQLSVLCQTTPFGAITKIPNIQNPVVPSSIVAYRTNVLIVPYYSGFNSIKLIGDKFSIENGIETLAIKSQQKPLTYAGVFNETPFLIFEFNNILYSPAGDAWISVLLPEKIIDVQINTDRVLLLGLNYSEKTVNIIETIDFVFFKRHITGLSVNPSINNAASIFSIDEKTFISIESDNNGKRMLYSSDDLTRFSSFDTQINDVCDAFYFNSKVLFVDNGANTFLSDKNFKAKRHLGFSTDRFTFKVINGIVFSSRVSASETGILNYSNDGDNWSSIQFVNNNNLIYTPSVCASKNSIFFVGDKQNIYKIGPISSSQSLNINSELTHSIRITGNIGQQVEILASDELNGEYKPLTYFTLPSTEYIYNDNRTNKAKQYYKVR